MSLSQLSKCSLRPLIHIYIYICICTHWLKWLQSHHEMQNKGRLCCGYKKIAPISKHTASLCHINATASPNKNKIQFHYCITNVTLTFHVHSTSNTFSFLWSTCNFIRYVYFIFCKHKKLFIVMVKNEWNTYLSFSVFLLPRL